MTDIQVRCSVRCRVNKLKYEDEAIQLYQKKVRNFYHIRVGDADARPNFHI